MLRGKTAIVTGGSRGIGRAIVLKMAEAGANTAIFYAGNEQAALETRKAAEAFGVRAQAYQCDVGSFEKTGESVRQVLEEFGGLDILVNNAGIVRDALLLSMKESDFDAVLNTNLKGAFNMTKHVYSYLMRRRAGSILNISSVAGITGNAGQANYAAAKAGLLGFTKSVAKELAGRGITCNAIAPGFIETDMTQALSDKVREAALGAVPMKRMGLPEEVAQLAVFLCSDAARYITGEVIRVDGGLCI